MSAPTASGLDGVVVADTRLSDVDGERGSVSRFVDAEGCSGDDGHPAISQARCHLGGHAEAIAGRGT
jgi:hypothetical protein